MEIADASYQIWGKSIFDGREIAVGTGNFVNFDSDRKPCQSLRHSQFYYRVDKQEVKMRIAFYGTIFALYWTQSHSNSPT